MPYDSLKQSRFMHARNPKIAKRFDEEMTSTQWKGLPKVASDEDIKKNVEGGRMDLDKMMRGKVLDDLMKDMDDFEFDKKLKPKVVTITIDTGGGKMEPEPGETMKHEMGESDDMEGMEDQEDMEGIDPRLWKLIRSKLG